MVMATISNSPQLTEEARRDAGLLPRRPHLPQRSWSTKILLADLTGVAVAVAVMNALLAWRSSPALPIGWALSFILLVPLVASARGTYSWRMHLDIVDGVSLPFVEVGLAWLLATSAWATLSSGMFRARPLVLTWATMALVVLLARAALYRWETGSRRRGAALRPTLIVGAGRVGTIVGRRLLQHSEFGLLPVGYLDDDPLEVAGERRLVPVIGGVAALEAVVAQHDIEQVVITFSRSSHEELLAVAERAAALGVDVALIPRLYEKTSGRVEVGRVGGLPLIDLRIVDPQSGYYLRVKYALDRVLAALALAIMSPVFAAVGAVIWITMGRPIFFRQIRVGRNGEHFVMLKFRTMASDASGEVVELPPDTAPGGVEGESDRRTAIGRFLRRSSIDELPQLLNVLKGEMSLIGPRPERPHFVRDFNSTIDGYHRRHRVKGGITGWSQVHGLRGQTSISERVEWDNYYIENISLRLDLKIIVLTVWALVRSMLPTARQQAE
jgi:exopolysaccharide biosynthesis polyprenyl glycosylphosphotransferase